MKKLKLKKETITKLNDDQMKKFVGGIRRAASSSDQSCTDDSCNSQANTGSCGEQSCNCEAHAPADHIR